MYQLSRGDRPKAARNIMFYLLVIGIFGAMISLIIYEVVDELRGSTHKLEDRYHE